jgi:hypothetical protein
MRDYDTAYFANYEDWVAKLLDVNFLDPGDRKTYTGRKLDDLLTDAWNFLSLEEREEEKEAQDFEDNL